MGLGIELQDEWGKCLQEVGDPRNLLPPLLPEDEEAYPMLTSIDLYGNTVFNRPQIRRFLREWEAVSARAETPEERMLVGAIEEMGTRCRDDVHLYLKFIGD